MKKLEMKRKQQGFTIIELVVVILLLGILTATALPRFIDVTDEAHNAVVDGVLGGLGTGTALFRAQWFATNQPATISEFGGMSANSAGYPIGIGPLGVSTITSVGTSANCGEIFQNILQLAGQPTLTTFATAATAPASLGTLTTVGLFDFVSYVQTGSAALKNVCYYFYTGQTARPASQDVPAIVYNAATGSVTRQTF
jgi:MSHA pilin protein MshB